MEIDWARCNTERFRKFLGKEDDDGAKGLDKEINEVRELLMEFKVSRARARPLPKFKASRARAGPVRTPAPTARADGCLARRVTARDLGDLRLLLLRQGHGVRRVRHQPAGVR
eukprot:2352299-Prymnesium_polylepis.1